MKKRRDSTSSEKLEKNKVRATIEALCEEKLVQSNDTLLFEALPSAINEVLLVVEEPKIADKYDVEQVSESLFQIKQKEIDI